MNAWAIISGRTNCSVSYRRAMFQLTWLSLLQRSMGLM